MTKKNTTDKKNNGKSPEKSGESKVAKKGKNANQRILAGAVKPAQKSNASKAPPKVKKNFPSAWDDNFSDKVKPGTAIRTRDEFFKDGVEKPNHINDNMYYRLTFVVDTNSLDELALAKSTSKKGHYLKTKPDTKFKPFLYLYDDKGDPIKLSDKFVRSVSENISTNDVEHILDRCRKYPDTYPKIKELKSRKKKPKK